jgi:hypothetical protein
MKRPNERQRANTDTRGVATPVGRRRRQPRNGRNHCGFSLALTLGRRSSDFLPLPLAAASAADTRADTDAAASAAAVSLGAPLAAAAAAAAAEDDDASAGAIEARRSATTGRDDGVTAAADDDDASAASNEADGDRVLTDRACSAGVAAATEASPVSTEAVALTLSDDASEAVAAAAVPLAFASAAPTSGVLLAMRRVSDMVRAGAALPLVLPLPLPLPLVLVLVETLPLAVDASSAIGAPPLAAERREIDKVRGAGTANVATADDSPVADDEADEADDASVDADAGRRAIDSVRPLEEAGGNAELFVGAADESTADAVSVSELAAAAVPAAVRRLMEKVRPAGGMAAAAVLAFEAVEEAEAAAAADSAAEPGADDEAARRLSDIVREPADAVCKDAGVDGNAAMLSEESILARRARSTSAASRSASIAAKRAVSASKATRADSI